MDGMEVLKSVRKWSNLPVVVVSARNHEHDKVDALDYGADDYLVKPFGTSELLARIRTAIRHTRTTLANSQIAQSGKFTAGDLTIDYDKHQVLIRGENAKLTVNEYKIVALLGKYAGKVLTYDFIIRELWGPKAKADVYKRQVSGFVTKRETVADDEGLFPIYIHPAACPEARRQYGPENLIGRCDSRRSVRCTPAFDDWGPDVYKRQGQAH